MKILHVVSGLDKSGGGTSEVIPRLALEQHKLGHDVTIAALNRQQISCSAYAAVSAGVAYEDKATKSFLFPKALGFSFDFKGRVEPLVRASDIIHLHGHWMYPPWCAGWLAQKYSKPYVMMPHGFLSPERLNISRLKKQIVGWLIEKPLLREAKAVVATSQSEAEGLRAYGVANQVYVMPIGLDLDEIDSGKRNNELLAQLGCDPSKKHLLYFSRITPIKGLDLLAEAWRNVNNQEWQLLIVGPDDRGYSREVRRIYADCISDGSVVVHDAVFGRDKFDLLKSVDAFVLPTRSENWSIAVAEAMAAKLPVVCTKGAPWGCISSVNAGCWVDVSAEGVANGVNTIFSMSAGDRAYAGRNGRRWVEENLDWRKIAGNMVDFYFQVCGR